MLSSQYNWRGFEFMTMSSLSVRAQAELKWVIGRAIITDVQGAVSDRSPTNLWNHKWTGSPHLSPQQKIGSERGASPCGRALRLLLDWWWLCCNACKRKTLSRLCAIAQHVTERTTRPRADGWTDGWIDLLPPSIKTCNSRFSRSQTVWTLTKFI
jgi:hypothetical protein